MSEAVSMAIDDLDLNEELPIIRLFGKGRKERLVPLGSMAKQALEAYLVRARPFFSSKGKAARTSSSTIGEAHFHVSPLGTSFNALQRSRSLRCPSLHIPCDIPLPHIY